MPESKYSICGGSKTVCFAPFPISVEDAKHQVAGIWKKDAQERIHGYPLLSESIVSMFQEVTNKNKGRRFTDLSAKVRLKNGKEQ